MKKILSVLLIALLVLAALAVTGVLLFRHFVADQIMDKGGMMNPDYVYGTDTAFILDGDYHTFASTCKYMDSAYADKGTAMQLLLNECTY